MGDVDVQSLPPVHIQEVSHVEPLRISKIAPAAIHVKELNHVDPLTIDSLRVDEVRNIDPVKVERFDVTYLPTVNLTIGETPELDLNLREIPPFAIGLHQDFVLPSEYFIRARLLGFEFLRVHVTGRTVMHARDQARREVSSSHERSYRQVAAVGNPAIPVNSREECAEAIVHERPARHQPRSRVGPRPRRVGGVSVGASHGVALGAPPSADVESAVSSL
jgi:hypothetical protein